MGAQALSPYQQMIEKTKSLALRSQKLVSDIERKATGGRGGESQPWAQEF